MFSLKGPFLEEELVDDIANLLGKHCCKEKKVCCKALGKPDIILTEHALIQLKHIPIPKPRTGKKKKLAGDEGKEAYDAFPTSLVPVHV